MAVELTQPHAVRATLAGGSAQERRLTTRAKRSEFQGQPHVALVEETAASAAAMNDQARSLASEVARFRLP